MGIAEGNVRHRNVRAELGGRVRDLDLVVGQRRAANGAEKRRAKDEPPMNAQPFADAEEGGLLARLRPLAVADVQRGDLLRAEFTDGKRRAHGRIHSTAERDDDIGLGTWHLAVGLWLLVLGNCVTCTAAWLNADA